jgi:hypothetical protein
MYKMENTLYEEKGNLMWDNTNSKFYFVWMVALEVKTLKWNIF